MHARGILCFVLLFSWRSCVHLHMKCMIQVYDLASSKQSELVVLTNVTYVHLHESNSEFGMGFQISWNGYCCSKWQQCLYDHGFTKLHFEWQENTNGVATSKNVGVYKMGRCTWGTWGQVLDLTHVPLPGTFTVGNIGRAVKMKKITVPLKSPTTINKTMCARSHKILPNPPDFLMFPMKKIAVTVLDLMWVKPAVMFTIPQSSPFL